MKNSFLLFVLLSCLNVNSQSTSTPAKPKLVVGIVVDQMRWDFLYRYQEKYAEGGFKRLLREGYKCENTHINYSPSYTAPGHASVYTGTVPAINGITGNYWYDYTKNRMVYCTEDSARTTVGAPGNTGKMSPKNMNGTTVSDEMKLSANFRSKTIGIALKDRGAILPAGHSADAAYFFDGATGNWVTSSYYMDTLPNWATVFNSKKMAAAYVANNWNTLLPLAQYVESHEDDVPFENPYRNETKPVFEHKVSALATPTVDIIRATPFGNTFTLEFAKAAVTSEKLGNDNFTDMLAISLSSTDYIGHQFGPNSVEIEDCYLRLDKDLQSFFAFLDLNVGKGNYVLFLTADHGAAHAAGYLQSKKIPSGSLNSDSLVERCNAMLESKFGKGKWLLTFENMQYYFNRVLIEELQIEEYEFKKAIRDFTIAQEGVADVMDFSAVDKALVNGRLKEMMINGYYPNRSGDMFVLMKPGWLEGFAKGTTHGTVYPYDTRIPLVFMGWKIKPASDFNNVSITDIAPTISAIVKCQEPSGCTGGVISGVLK